MIPPMTMVQFCALVLSSPMVLGLRLASSSSIIGVSASTLKVSLGHFLCRWCKKEIPLQHMCPTRIGVCVIDNAAYIALVKRWGKQRALNTWWDGMGGQDRLEWFLNRIKIQVGVGGSPRWNAQYCYNGV